MRPNKERYFFGEEITLTYELRNGGGRPFPCGRGGDYRGATRHLSFHVEAVHADGTAMPDPHPNQNCWGGIGIDGFLEPGEAHTDAVPLLDYRRLEKPGRYRVTVEHDGPVAETWIELRDPSLGEAHKLLDDLDREFAARPKDSLFNFLSGHRRLTHPAYLPLVAVRARAGSDAALTALGETPDPAATKILVELLDHKDPAFVAKVEEALYLRLPDPELDGQVQRRRFFDSDDSDPRKYLRDAAWRPEFAAAVRAHARRGLAKGDQANLFRGAFQLCCVGTAEDWPALRAAFDAALIATNGEPIPEDHYPRAPGACAELRRAVQMLVARQTVVPATPAPGADRILFVETIRRRREFRPPGWEAIYTAALRDPADYVRRVAVESLPDPIPAFARPLVPGLLADAHVDVQIAACQLVEKVKAPEWKAALLKTLAAAQETWLIRAARRAAHELCTQLEQLEAHVAKLDDPKAAAEALSGLTMIFHDSSGGSMGADLGTPEKRQACQAAWRQFLADNRERLTRPEPFSLRDPIPTKALFPGYQFSLPRKRRTGAAEASGTP